MRSKANIITIHFLRPSPNLVITIQQCLVPKSPFGGYSWHPLKAAVHQLWLLPATLSVYVGNIHAYGASIKVLAVGNSLFLRVLYYA